jgi:hypothetical protein
MQLLTGVSQTALVRFGQSQTGYTVSYQILNANGTVNQAYTTSGVVEIGFGDYGVSLSFGSAFTGFIQWRAVKAAQTTLYATEEISVVDDFVSKIATILKIESGKWKIIGTNMYFYDTDGTTILYQFNLLDSAGSPSSTSVFERRPF